MEHCPASAARCCAVTGASGYLGSGLVSSLTAQGWTVYQLTRAPAAGNELQVDFSLADGAPENFFTRHSVQSLVHCSYDFQQTRWKDIVEHNVRGSIRLMRAARDQGVKRIVFISTMSAFEGCASRYGRAKLQIEKEAEQMGAAIVRPGLIFGDQPGGMVGALAKAVGRLPVVPLIGRGNQVLYAAHEADLITLITRLLDKALVAPGPIIAAAEQALTFRQIVLELAARRGKRVYTLPVPWRLVWASLRTAEACGLRLGFRSDSVISLVHQDPRPNFELTRQSAVVFRDFADRGDGPGHER